MYAFFVNFFVTILFNKSHIVRAVYYNIIYSGKKYLQLKYCIQILYLLPAFWRAVLIIVYLIVHFNGKRSVPIFVSIGLPSSKSIALRTDQCSCLSAFTVPFIFAFSTMENGHLKSLESQFRFVCPHFGSINSNCALRYL